MSEDGVLVEQTNPPITSAHIRARQLIQVHISTNDCVCMYMVSHFRNVISNVQFSEVSLTLPLQGTCYVWSLSSGVGTSLITLTPQVKKNTHKRYAL